MADPFREHRLRPKDVRRILRRAAELADSDPRTASSERSLTVDEIQRTAAELGLPASAVAQAIGRDDPAGHEDELTEPSGLLGAPRRIALEIETEGEPDESDMEDLVDDIRDVIGATGYLESVGKTMIWRIANGSPGQGARDLSVRVRTRSGRTRIVIEERLGSQAVGLFLGVGLFTGIAPVAAYKAAVLMFGAAGLLVPLVWLSLMFVLARTLFVALVQRRERLLLKLQRRLERRAAGWSKRSTARVAAAPPQRVAVEAAADADAASEDEDGDVDEHAAPVRRAHRA